MIMVLSWSVSVTVTDEVQMQPNFLMAAGLFDRPRISRRIVNAQCKRAFHKSCDFGGTMNPHTSAHSSGIVGPGGIGKSVSANASSRVLVGRKLLSLHCRHAAPLKSPTTRSTCSSCKTARIVRKSFFPMPRFLATKALMCRDMTEKVYWPLRDRRRNVAFETTPCITHPDYLSCTFRKPGCRGGKTEDFMSEKKVFKLNKKAHPP